MPKYTLRLLDENDNVVGVFCIANIVRAYLEILKRYGNNSN
jgi:hypothetical protein